MSLSAGLIAPIVEGATRPGGAIAPPPPTPIVGAGGADWRRQLLPRRTSFEEQLIIYGRIRKPFIHDYFLAGSIRRGFVMLVFFAATVVKHVNEAVSIDGFIITDDIPMSAWEALFESIEENEE